PALAPAEDGLPAPAASEPLLVRYALDDDAVTATRPHQPGWKLDAAAFLLDLPTESEAVLVVGPELRRIPRGRGGSELLGRAAAGAAAWRRERARALRRQQLPARLLAFSEELHRAHTLHAVCSTLMTHAGRIVGGYTGVIYLYDNNGAGEEALYPLEHPWITRGLQDCSLSADLRFRGPGEVRADDVLPGTGSPFDNLSPLIRETGAATLYYVPLSEVGLLFVIERRAGRSLDADDWDLLRSVARQAEVALERVTLFQRVHELTLTDPLTGLGNRRKLEIELEPAFAAARRGQPLSVVMIDIDGFKDFNDLRGHLAGDDVLRRVADCLREQVRGADLVVRYGGDEFLLVMAGATAEAAETTVARIRAHLEDRINFTAGIAEYALQMSSPHEIVDAADQALYAVRRERARADRRMSVG
ncbi:MAG: sensor domain-containing diguanylate cyclase, partial [Gemmatimonadetes bacterium]|nr:sensor domain-containing diguanylate cyclase [Gemmatimonadota bacterium]